MAQENVEIARQFLDAVTRRDLSQLIALSTPDFEWQSFFAIGEQGGVYRGHDSLPQYLDDLADAWEIVRPVGAEFVTAGNVVVGVGRVHYKGKASGVETDAPAGWMFKFRDGKVLCCRAFQDPEQALEAVGLKE